MALEYYVPCQGGGEKPIERCDTPDQLPALEPPIASPCSSECSTDVDRATFINNGPMVLGGVK